MHVVASDIPLSLTTVRGCFMGPNLCPYISHCFRECVPLRYIALQRLVSQTRWSPGTSPHVLRFTGFDHRRDGVSEGVCEAPDLPGVVLDDGADLP